MEGGVRKKGKQGKEEERPEDGGKRENRKTICGRGKVGEVECKEQVRMTKAVRREKREIRWKPG